MTTPFDSDRDNRNPVDVPPLPPVPEPVAGGDGTAQLSAGLTRFPALAAFLALVPGLGHLYVGCLHEGRDDRHRDHRDHRDHSVADQRVPRVVHVVLRDLRRLPPGPVWSTSGVQEPLQKSGDGGQGSLAFGVFLTVVGVLLLINNFFPLEMDWLRDWWPAIPVLVGIYLIGSALYERSRRTTRESLDLDD